MSSATPTYLLQELVGRKEQGVIVATKDFRKYMLDLNGWFMWWGSQWDMSGKSLGAGLTKMIATRRN